MRVVVGAGGSRRPKGCEPSWRPALFCFVFLGVIVRPPGNKPRVAARGAWAQVGPISESVSAETPPRLCATDLPPSLPPTSRAVIRGRLDFVVAVHGLQGRLRLTIARLELGPRGLCLPHVVFRSGGVWRARQPAPVPRTRRRSPHSARPLLGRARRAPAARLLGAAPSGSLRLHWRRTPPLPLTPRRPSPPWGRQAPAGAPPCAPWHLRRAPRLGGA